MRSAFLVLALASAGIVRARALAATVWNLDLEMAPPPRNDYDLIPFDMNQPATTITTKAMIATTAVGH